jgi:hypothetical protein
VALDNAKRSMERATYTPVERRSEVEDAPAQRRALDKHAFAVSLAATDAELTAVARRKRRSKPGPEEKAALKALKALAPDPDGTRSRVVDLSAVPSFADIGPEALIRISGYVGAIRREQRERRDSNPRPPA